MMYVSLVLGALVFGLALGMAIADRWPLKSRRHLCTICQRPQAEHDGYAQLHVWEGK
jgi:hypothetical protein